VRFQIKRQFYSNEVVLHDGNGPNAEALGAACAGIGPGRVINSRCCAYTLVCARLCTII
jgi:hypothetical protein